MGWHDYSAHRAGNLISISMGGRQTEKRAREFAAKSLQPWEVLAPRLDASSRTGHWIFAIDEERSANRKLVLDAVIHDLDETDKASNGTPASPTKYLHELSDTIDRIMESSG